MREAADRELVLYVASRRVVTGVYEATAPSSPVLPDAAYVGGGQIGEGPGREGRAPLAEEWQLPEEQGRCVALVESVASARGRTLKVHDVGRGGTLERLVAERLRGVHELPVLILPSGERLVGASAFTAERLAALLPAELSGSTRAFTYIKVRGGDIEPIRAALLAFPQVHELHVLTGDWDLFVVLDFPASPTAKRAILDFVTSKIRTIPDVLDTSTLLPELSVTKRQL